MPGRERGGGGGGGDGVQEVQQGVPCGVHQAAVGALPGPL